MGNAENPVEISLSDIGEIIALNQRIMAKNASEFECDEVIIETIARQVNGITAPDHLTLTIRRATRLLGGITFRQPFFDGNKETALAMTIRYLNRNGYDLPIEDAAVQQAAYEQLMNMEFGKGDNFAYNKLESFLLARVRKKID